MAGMTWLHLSDWHQGSEAFVEYQKSEAFDRELLSKRLREDILNRTRISTDLAKIDFFIFSGDVTFSGKAEEYQAANAQFLKYGNKRVGDSSDDPWEDAPRSRGWRA